MKNKKVFLGGTCNDSKWRDKLIPQLKIDYFNPVVSNWTEQHQIEEVKQRSECDFLLYVISPLMSGVYSIAEAVDDSNKHPEKTIFHIMPSDEDKDGKTVFLNVSQIKSLSAVGRMIKSNGGIWLLEFSEIATLLNSQVENDEKKILSTFSDKLLKDMVDCPAEYTKVLNDNFSELLG